MKKNAMLKIAAILLVAVLLTTCAISSTFAKYVTPSKSITSNTGRVAAWGIEITGTASANATLFTSNYTDAIALSTATNKNILAPGTSYESDALKLGISGQPEVDYQIDVTADVAILNWELEDDTFYCPVVVTVDGTAISGLNYANAGAFELAIENAIADAILGGTNTGVNNVYTKTYVAGTAVPATAEEVKVSWAWAIEDATGTEYNQSNVNDTYLGDVAADNETAAATIQIVTFSIGAQQVSTVA